MSTGAPMRNTVNFSYNGVKGGTSEVPQRFTYQNNTQAPIATRNVTSVQSQYQMKDNRSTYTFADNTNVNNTQGQVLQSSIPAQGGYRQS